MSCRSVLGSGRGRFFTDTRPCLPGLANWEGATGNQSLALGVAFWPLAVSFGPAFICTLWVAFSPGIRPAVFACCQILSWNVKNACPEQAVCTGLEQGGALATRPCRAMGGTLDGPRGHVPVPLATVMVLGD